MDLLFLGLEELCRHVLTLRGLSSSPNGSRTSGMSLVYSHVWCPWPMDTVNFCSGHLTARTRVRPVCWGQVCLRPWVLPDSRSPAAQCSQPHTGCGSSRWETCHDSALSTAGHR